MPFHRANGFSMDGENGDDIDDAGIFSQFGLGCRDCGAEPVRDQVVPTAPITPPPPSIPIPGIIVQPVIPDILPAPVLPPPAPPPTPSFAPADIIPTVITEPILSPPLRAPPMGPPRSLPCC